MGDRHWSPNLLPRMRPKPYLTTEDMIVADINLTAPDISCARCKEHIERDLAAIPRVRRVDVTVASKTITVDYDEKTTDLSLLRDSLSELGYPAAG